MQVLTQSEGGPADHVADLAQELIRSGPHEVVVIAPASSRGALSQAVGIQRKASHIMSAFDLRGLVRLVRDIRAWHPDVIHLQDRRSGLLGRLAARFAGVPAVYTLHGAPNGLAHLVPNNAPGVSIDKMDRFMYLTVERWLARYSRCRVVVASDALRSYAVDAIGLAHDMVDVVPNGIRLDHFHPTIPSGDFTVVWLGLMVDVKRLDVLIEAVARSSNIPLVVVGDGPLRGIVEAQVDRLGVAGFVTLAGFQSDPRAWLQQAHVAALTSDAENCPLALLQAMASGCAIVATSVGGVSEIVRHEKEGLLVPPGDVGAVSAAFERLRADDELRRLLAHGALARVRDFMVQEMAQKIIATYSKAIAAHA